MTPHISGLFREHEKLIHPEDTKKSIAVSLSGKDRGGGHIKPLCGTEYRGSCMLVNRFLDSFDGKRLLTWSCRGLEI